MRRIVSTPCTNSGSPRIDGTRLTCANVAQRLRNESLDEYLLDYPHLTIEDIRNCLFYCSRRQCVRDTVHSYCEQCTLDTRPDIQPLAFFTDEYDGIVRNPKATEQSTELFAGTEDDYISDGPEDVWKLAATLLTRYFPDTVDTDLPTAT